MINLSNDIYEDLADELLAIKKQGRECKLVITAVKQHKTNIELEEVMPDE